MIGSALVAVAGAGDHHGDDDDDDGPDSVDHEEGPPTNTTTTTTTTESSCCASPTRHPTMPMPMPPSSSPRPLHPPRRHLDVPPASSSSSSDELERGHRPRDVWGWCASFAAAEWAEWAAWAMATTGPWSWLVLAGAERADANDAVESNGSGRDDDDDKEEDGGHGGGGGGGGGAAMAVAIPALLRPILGMDALWLPLASLCGSNNDVGASVGGSVGGSGSTDDDGEEVDDFATTTSSAHDDDDDDDECHPRLLSAPSAPLPVDDGSSSGGGGKEARGRRLLWTTKKKKWQSLRTASTSPSSSTSSSSMLKTRAKTSGESLARNLTFSPSFESPPAASSTSNGRPGWRQRRGHSEDLNSSSAARAHSGADEAGRQIPPPREQLRNVQRLIEQGRERVSRWESVAAKAKRKVIKLQEALRAEQAAFEEHTDSLALAKDELAQLQSKADALHVALSGTDTPARAEIVVSRRRSYTADAAVAAGRHARHRVEKSASEAGLWNRTSSPELARHGLPPMGSDETTMTPPPPHRPRASTDSKLVRKTSLACFMRVSDLAVPRSTPCEATGADHGGDIDYGDDSFSSCTMDGNSSLHHHDHPDFFWLDENFPIVLDRLWRLGWEYVTGESSSRFRYVGTGSHHTATLGPHNCIVRTESDEDNNNWPVHPWHEPIGSSVLLWVGSSSTSNDGLPQHGHDWPVVKARGLVRAAPRQVLDLLLDSSLVHVYNKMSAVRRDVSVLQEDVDTSSEDSPYGFDGLAKVTRSVMKPRLLPKPIETVSLWHAKPLPTTSSSSGACAGEAGYMIVTRSVWDGPTPPPLNGHSPTSKCSTLRSEMLLGVHLCRPIRGSVGPATMCCELTSVTHVVPTGVPEYLAKRMAPSNAASALECIQSHFAA